MSLLKGIQSCIFYYLSCSPCTKCIYRRKRRKEAIRAREEKAAIEAEQPGLFRQPSPFSTNVYWREELMLGPGPPPKRGGKESGGKADGLRQLMTGGHGSSLGSSGGLSLGDSNAPTEVDDGVNSEDWNKKRYQREDEELWGILTNESHLTESNIMGTSTGLVGIPRAGTISPEKYHVARNPPISDFHPPVVSTQPTHKSETRWMLQPPPSAKVMSGKERANRSRSGSGTSSRKGGDASLGRQVGERLLEEKVKRGERPPTSEGIPMSQISYGGEADSHRDGGSEMSLAQPPLSSVDLSKRAQPPPISISEDQIQSPQVAWHPPSPSKDALRQTHQRPIPSRIASASHLAETMFTRSDETYDRPTSSPSNSKSLLPSPNLAPSKYAIPPFKNRTKPTNKHLIPPRPVQIVDSNSSLHILQEFASPTSNSALNSRPASPLPESRIRLPPTDSKEDVDLSLPECETWFPGNFRFPDPSPITAGRGTTQKKENHPSMMTSTATRMVTGRWSMDI
ncbi:MAG: hypothetical protein M1827_006547 [Pycnora praestabilis]|nr:MAG: hypothetical protein M1827_006547 [Pycnora praestabilis]